MMRVKRIAAGVVLALLAVSGALVLSGIRGATAAQNVVAATPTPASFATGALVQIKAGVPFAFLRSAASSKADVVDNAKTGEFVIILSDSPQFDGVQWWWFVERGSGNVAGWVEQNSLQVAIVPATDTPIGTTSAPTLPPVATIVPTLNLPVATTPVPAATIAPIAQGDNNSTLPVVTVVAQPIGTAGSADVSAAWGVGTRLILAPGVPFAWVRGAASSNAYIRATVYPGYSWSYLSVRDANPVWDGTQFWWLVNVPALNVYGWVEQKSLMFAPLPPTSTATTVPPTSTVVPTVLATDMPTNIPTDVPTTAPTIVPTDMPTATTAQ